MRILYNTSFDNMSQAISQATEALAEARGRLADRLTSEMMIEYLVPVGSKPADVKVGIRVAGARVRGLGVAPR